MNHPELSCGNIADTPLSQIWKKSQMMAKIRDVKQLFGKCAKCRHLSLCRGGCRAMAYLRYQKIDASDPLCVVEP